MTTTTMDAGTDSRREIRTLSIVATVHLVSHFYWLLFVPLLPSLKEMLGVGYVELSFALFVMNIVSAVIQAPTGFVVERVGPRLSLVFGVALGSAGFILLGLVPTYSMLLAAAVLVGVSNAVYHPADYSILSAEMSAARMGRAYSLHTFSGYLGFALTPPIVLGLVYASGPRVALIASAVIGAAMCLPLLADIGGERAAVRTRRAAPAKERSSALSLFTPTVLALTLMFTTLNLSTNMMQTYMVASLETLHGLPRVAGESALTVFMFTLVAGVLAGGFVADRAKSKGLVTLGGFGCAALVTLAVGSFHLGAVPMVSLVGLAGLLAGLVMPSRDMLVRLASPPDAVGPVFGIVTTGFNLGGMIGPPVGGWLIDHAMPVWIFYGSAFFMAVTIAIAVLVEKNSVRR